MEKYTHKEVSKTYRLLLNGRHYGEGEQDRILDLIYEWVANKDMYGEDVVDFTIERLT